MTKARYLTGITTSGTPHLGNYVGAIRPAISSSRQQNHNAFYFLADLHALIKCQDPEKVRQSGKEIAATWMALGLDTQKAVFYRQSDVPEISELCWILTCVSAKGLMNRAHAYKANVDANREAGDDTDNGITMGLYSYPILMAADILMFNATHVPVGKDQLQHIEMARDIAARFNHFYGETFTLPQAVVDDSVATLQGLDGRKMSKSYNNTIPLFLPEKKLKKHINKIKTNLLEPGEPKDADTSTVFQLYTAFASPEQASDMRKEFENGIAWGESKKQLFELINEQIKPYREHYEALLEDTQSIEKALQLGAQRARDESVPFMRRIKKATGIGLF